MHRMRFCLGSVLLLCILVVTILPPAIRHNVITTLTLRGLTGDGISLARAVGALAEEESCRARWLAGLAYHALGDAERRDISWQQFLACEPSGTPFVEKYLPEDRAWAQWAVNLLPDRAEPWLWLARLAERDDPALAAEAYRRGLEIRPYDGMLWQSYGFVLLETAGEEAALQAFIRSCELGSNGCRRVGAIMERRSDLRTAIKYYRADPNPMFHRYADELERRLQVQESLR